MQYRINLTAGQEQRQQVAGRVLQILSITGAASLSNIRIEINGSGVEELTGVTAGLRIRAPGNFGAVVLKSAVDCTVELFISFADISVNQVEGATVNANILGVVPVSNDRGAPGTPVYVSGITYSDAPATAIVDNAATACGDVAVALLAASAGRKRARFTNLGPDDVTLGTTGHTWAKRCIVLAIGDTWLESDAANLAWVGITDAGNAASVTVQEVSA